MEKYELNKNNIKLHNILYAVTSPNGYEMYRYLLLEDMPDTKWDEYVVVEGFHCSCYDFDDTKWEAIKYTKEELVKLAEVKVNENFWDKTEKCLYNYILHNFKR